MRLTVLSCLFWFLFLASIATLVRESDHAVHAQSELGTTLLDPRSRIGAPAVEVPGLNLFRSLTVPGDYVASGVGLRGATQGSINISGIPSGASVIEAYLYWGMLDNGESPSLKNVTLNGTALVGALIGSGPDTNWGRSNSFAYRASVTSIVVGNGIYVLTGVASGSNILAQGASLVVIYQKTGEPYKNIVVMDGDSVYKSTDQSITTTITTFQAAAPVSAKTTFIVGDGQSSAGDSVSFTGGAGTVVFTNIFDESDGPLWDTDTFDVSAQIGPGDSFASANLPQFGGDALMWVGQVFSVTTNPPFDVCIQDESNGNILRLNIATGNYQFTNCAGLTIGGTGAIIRKGGIISFQAYGADRRVLALVDTSAGRATASVQILPIGRTFTIIDRNITNNSCSC